MSDRRQKYERTKDSRRKVSRRAYLGATAAGGIGITLSGIGKASIDGPVRKVEIDSVKWGDEVLETKRVDADWYQRVEWAREAISKLRTMLPSATEERLTYLSPESQKSSGGPVLNVVTKEDSDLKSVPERVEDITVRTRTGLNPQFTGTENAECYGQAYDPVKPGAPINAEGADYEDNSFTAGFTMSQPGEDGYKILTVRHGVASICDPADDPTGETVEQWGEQFGTVEKADANLDAAIISLDEDGERDEIVNEFVDGGGIPLAAHFTEDAIAYMAEENVSLSQRGIRTCNTSMAVHAYDGSLEAECDDTSNEITDLVMTDLKSNVGDSGAVKSSIRPHQFNHWVAGCLQVAIDGSLGVDLATGAYAIQDAFDERFGYAHDR